MKIHELKIEQKYLDLLEEGKDFEVRYNDRDFEVGDLVILKSDNSPRMVLTITHLYKDLPGLKKGYCIFKFVFGKFEITNPQ
jgi:ASC-1-like (ASCH) protein